MTDLSILLRKGGDATTEKKFVKTEGGRMEKANVQSASG